LKNEFPDRFLLAISLAVECVLQFWNCLVLPREGIAAMGRGWFFLLGKAGSVTPAFSRLGGQAEAPCGLSMRHGETFPVSQESAPVSNASATGRQDCKITA
jgi:hypothetical protein